MADSITGPVTEVVYLSLIQGIDLEDPKNKTILNESLDTIASQKGLKTLFWGRQVEHPDTLQMVIDWENLDGHRAFMNSPEYQPFLEKLGTLQDGSIPFIFHLQVPAGQDQPDPRTAKVTECISAYFDEAQDQDGWMQENWMKFRAEGINGEGVQGLMAGWSVERHKHEKLGDGVEGKFVGAFIGWPSIEAHQQFRTTEHFKRIIPLMRTGPVGLAVHHVEFKRRV